MSEINNIEFNEATLIAYINNELSAEVRSQVEIWLDTPENQKEFDQLKKVWNATKELNPKPVNVDTEAALNKVLTKINKEPIQLESPKKQRKIFFAAAAVMALLFASVTLINYLSNTPIQQLELTASNSVLEDTLTDGTLVSLNENSILSYPSKFPDTERRVALTGEAFFDVNRDETKPFIIELHNDFYVKVLGTSFNINANENDSITTVFVKSGKVEFGSANNKIILVAGEKGVMNNKTGEVKKLIEEYGELKELYWKTQELNFDHVDLTQTLGILRQVFSADIILNCEEKSKAQVVSHHTGESLEQILDVIASLHQMKIIKSKSAYTLECNE